jgi:flagellar biosynthetic protein FliR
MIESTVLSFALILARTGAFVGVLPMLGSHSTPRTVKVGLAFALAVLYFQILGVSAIPEVLTANGSASWSILILVLLKEALLGAFLGFAMGLILLPIRIAGEYLGAEMGLAMGAQADPTAPNPSVVVTQLFEMLAGVLFFSLDGHHLFFAALHSTFLRIPLGSWSGMSAVGPMTAGMTAAQEWGLMLAAPVGAMLFLSSVVLALMTRAAPQMNVFAFGYAVRIGFGLLGLFVLMPGFIAAVTRSLARMGQLLERLV